MASYMTDEELRARLGLKPHAEFEFEVLLNLAKMAEIHGREYAIQQRARGTGRTTEMLLRAFKQALDGRSVGVMTSSFDMSDRLRVWVNEWCNKLNVTPTFCNRSYVAFENGGSIRLIRRGVNIEGYSFEHVHADHNAV